MYLFSILTNLNYITSSTLISYLYLCHKHLKDQEHQV
jgi:hypothetical protein